jgi:hypothetical protein
MGNGAGSLRAGCIGRGKGVGEAVDILYMRLKNEFTADQGSSPAESSQSERLDIPYALEGLREKKNSR